MLSELPFELLSEIVSYLPTAQTVHHLALSCRKLNEFVNKEGWKVFVRSRFPSIKLDFQAHPDVLYSWKHGAGLNGFSNGAESLSSSYDLNPETKYWQDASHALTTLSRNYDRRAFIARYLEPSGSITYLPSGERKQRWRRPRGQTMGYQPVIDSYEEWTANDWASRREVLAWSAGAELMMRVKHKGWPASDMWNNSTAEQKALRFDHHRHIVEWFSYKIPGSLEGRDDITAVKLLRSSETTQTDGKNVNQRIMMGTANGDLLMLALPLHNFDVPPSEHTTSRTSSASISTTRFITNERSVHSADISPLDTPLLAACLSGTRIAIYPTQNLNNQANIKPIDEITAVPEGRRGYRVWSTSFLSENRLAVGLGPSPEPVHVYEATPTGLSKDPLRKFGIDGTHWACDDRIDTRPATTKQSSSVYPITPIPPSSQAGHAAGDTFLSGCYDGIIRLHDLRDPSAYTCSYWDPTDDSAIYSLVTLGRERLVAGSSRHSIVKFFDLRVSGGRCYHHTDVRAAAQPVATPAANGEARPSAKNNRCGWNLFINPRNRTFGGNRGANSWARRSAESPIYSLSSPSAASPSLFAGVENNVVQLDFVAMLDRHPDPVFADGIVRRPSNPPSAPRRGGFSRNPPALARGPLRAALSVPKGDGRVGDIDIKQTWDPRGDALNLAMYEQSSAAGGGVMRLRVQEDVGPMPRQARVLRGYDERWRDGSEV